MAELLSQSQIDELLGLAKSGTKADSLGSSSKNDKEDEVDGVKFKKYDFYSPKKISKKRLKLLDGIYGSYARTVSSYITGLLRIGCSVELVTMEEQRYYEFNNALSENDIISTINLNYANSREGSHLLLQMSNEITLAAIDRLLGGNGVPEDIGNDSYTDIELAIYETLVKKIVSLQKGAWDNYFDIEFKYFRYETNPRLVQSISPDEIVVIIVLSVEIGDTTGSINICMPSPLLSDIFEKLEKESQNANNHQSEDDIKNTDNLVHNIYNTELELKADLGEMYVLMSDLFSMQVGDIINLSKPKDSKVYVNIEGKPWFTGKLGAYKQNKAVQV
ncbi:MAG: flagellar motor switch protein FliM, partial [Oscillospiraceae bacterium]